MQLHCIGLIIVCCSIANISCSSIRPIPEEMVDFNDGSNNEGPTFFDNNNDGITDNDSPVYVMPGLARSPKHFAAYSPGGNSQTEDWESIYELFPGLRDAGGGGEYLPTSPPLVRQRSHDDTSELPEKNKNNNTSVKGASQLSGDQLKDGKLASRRRSSSNQSSPPNDRSSTSALTGAQGKPHVCGDCGKRFKFECLLKRHQLIHSDHRSYICDVCGHASSRQEYLKTHLLTHSGVRLYTCNVCDYASSRKDSLQRHLLTHSDENHFECEECGKVYKSKSALRKHVGSHNGDRTYVCTDCGRKFRWEYLLKQHQATHSDQKHFKCEQCGKEFKMKNLLKKHLFIHSGGRGWEKELAGRDDLKTHRLEHTGVTVGDLMNPTGTQQSPNVTRLLPEANRNQAASVKTASQPSGDQSKDVKSAFLKRRSSKQSIRPKKQSNEGHKCGDSKKKSV